MNTGTMKLLPAKPGSCAMCATEHGEHDPHNFWSLFYQMRFRMKYGRDATHADCVAHLAADRQGAYQEAVEHFRKEWSSHDSPVAEPYAAH